MHRVNRCLEQLKGVTKRITLESTQTCSVVDWQGEREREREREKGILFKTPIYGTEYSFTKYT
jgi:hypothetical protein